jgi:hypothetical protein
MGKKQLGNSPAVIAVTAAVVVDQNSAGLIVELVLERVHVS